MQELRVDTAALQAMASRWSTSASELTEAEIPSMPGTSDQPSATAVNAAHADVGVFNTELASRVNLRATHVANANTQYIAGEDHSASELDGALNPTTTV